MSLSSPFIHRPVAILIDRWRSPSLARVAFGKAAVSAFGRKLDFPTISVSAMLPGASPEIMGFVGCHAARTQLAECRRNGNDVGKLTLVPAASRCV